MPLKLYLEAMMTIARACLHPCGSLALVLTMLLAASPVYAAAQSELFKLAPDDNSAGDTFGFSAAISGPLAIFGAVGDTENGFGSGSAYLYTAATGQQRAKLLPSDGAPNDQFGWSVGLSGATAIVGANQDDDNGSQSGSAYLFDAVTGLQIIKLLASDGAADDYFGWSVGIDGDTAIAGAYRDDDNGFESGSAYLFDATTGQQTFKLLANDGAADDFFGGAVAVGGTTAIVGASHDDDDGPNSGSAYLFDTATGQQFAKLTASDGQAFDLFGSSVAICGTTAVVGAWGDGDNGSASGSAYVFDTTTGQQIAKLTASDGASSDTFGRDVAVCGATAIVGARADDDNGIDSGSAYLYDTATGQQVAKLIASDGQMQDRFGGAVGIAGGTAVVGAQGDDDNGSFSGAAYVFDVSPGAAYCFGDGSGAVCPCNNTGGLEEGCEHSGGAGARLRATGTASIAAGDLTLLATNAIPGQPGLFFQGLDAAANGDGLPFGDGLRCATGGVIRLGVGLPGPGGCVATDGSCGAMPDGPIDVATEGGVAPGDVRRYQFWYRDPVGGPCGSGFNLTNGFEVLWGA